jgi:hypothetical protein
LLALNALGAGGALALREEREAEIVMTVYPAEFHKQCEQKWECRAASRLYESA